MDEKGKEGKIERRLKRLDDNALILQKMSFNPTNFALTKLLILDKTNNRKMEMNFDEFEKVMNKDYPGTVDMNFNSETALILQKMSFNPTNFALTKLLILDKTNNRKMEMNFDEFEKVMNKDYPGTVDMNFNSETDNISLKIQMSGFSTEKVDALNLKIPEKYQQIKVN